jgi:hypothetical protein
MVSRKQRGHGSESSKQKVKMASSRPVKPKRRTVYDYMDLPPDQLTPAERKNLEEFKAKAKALEKIFTSKCKICGELIPEGWDYCGTEHINQGTRNEQRSVQKATKSK